MDAPYSPLEYTLLNQWQRDFPLVPAPFDELARNYSRGGTARTGEQITEADVLDCARRLSARGAISRIGAVFAARRIGAAALAAVAAPNDRIDEIAAIINAHPHVNHNYQREHRLNLWFVVTAPDMAARAQVLEDIARDTGCTPISMPLLQEFHIDLGFDLVSGHSPTRHRPASNAPVRSLCTEERRLAAALQDGLALVPHPYAELARRAQMDEAAVLNRLRDWQLEGLVKRFGVVVQHHALGYRANAMVVFDVPDVEAAAIGERLAQVPGVTLCYRRERCLPQWRYNLYCMVHGRSRAEVAPIISRLKTRAGCEPEVLFSIRRYKQCGARYFA